MQAGLPGLIPMGITKRWIEANKISNIDEIFDPNQKGKPDPKAEELYLKMGLLRDKHELEKQELFSKILINLANIRKIYTGALLDVAKAEAAEAGPQIEQYKAYVDHLGVQLDAQEAQLKQKMEVGGGQPQLGPGAAPGQPPENPDISNKEMAGMFPGGQQGPQQ
jgi:hypothetical protein